MQRAFRILPVSRISDHVYVRRFQLLSQNTRKGTMKLRDRVALITGGTAGIGEAVAVRFASEGAKVAVIASTDINKADRVAHNILEAGGVARPFVADVSEVSQIESMVEAVVAAFGDVHILVNAAGIVGGTPAGTTSEAEYDRVMDTNLKGTFFCANAVVPLMKANGSGHIVNISGIGAFRSSSGGAAYCASQGRRSIRYRGSGERIGPTRYPRQYHRSWAHGHPGERTPPQWPRCRITPEETRRSHAEWTALL